MHWKILPGALFAASFVSAAPAGPHAKAEDVWPYPHDKHFKPTVEHAAIEARTLVMRESLANVATLDDGYPVSFMQYFADCNHNGSLTFLALEGSQTFKNIDSGSPASLSIRVNEHHFRKHASPFHPDFNPKSSARNKVQLSLRGKFVDVLPDEVETGHLASCFFKRHPDAVRWLPELKKAGQNSKWVQFDVTSVYFVGGVGKRAFIGDVPVELYNQAKPIVRHHKNKSHHWRKKCSHKKQDHSSWFEKLHFKGKCRKPITSYLTSSWQKVLFFLKGEQYTPDNLRESSTSPSNVQSNDHVLKTHDEDSG